MPSRAPAPLLQAAAEAALQGAPLPVQPAVNQPSPQVSPEPCSACGRLGVLFSKRQMQVDAARRRCLECLPGRETTRAPPLVPATPATTAAAVRPALPVMPIWPPQLAVQDPEALMPLGESAPKPCTAPEPCSQCGRLDMLFSKRQMKVEPSRRKCLECMPSHKPELVAQVTLQAALGSHPADQPPTLPDANLPKPCSAPEPCSGCNRVGVFFSKRQMQIEPSRRKCLECLPPRVAGPRVADAARSDLVAAAATVAAESTEPPAEVPAMQPASLQPTNLPNPQMAAEPCSGCGRLGVLFSKRQIQVEASRRRCLECLPPRVKATVVEAGAATPCTDWGIKRLKAADGHAQPVTSPATNLPNPQSSPEPCSCCGRMDVLFSKRQMSVEPSARRCLECLPPRVRCTSTAVPATGMVPKKRKFSEVATKIAAAGFSTPQTSHIAQAHLTPLTPQTLQSDTVPPKENLTADPCSKCGRMGVPFSNRQMKFDAAQRMCIECMADQRRELRELRGQMMQMQEPNEVPLLK